MQNLACTVESALPTNSLLGKSFINSGTAIYFDTDGSHAGYASSTPPFTKDLLLAKIITYVIRGTTISFIICDGGLTPGTYGTYDTATRTLNFSGTGWALLYDDLNSPSYPPRVELLAGTSHTIRLLQYNGANSDTFSLIDSESGFKYGGSVACVTLKNHYTIPNLSAGQTYGSILLTKDGPGSFALLVPTFTV
jgi:hypothetical protein